MKKALILLFAALMLATMLTACAASQPYYYDGYSNVSTTRDGRVNGTNGYDGTHGGMYNGSYVPGYNPGYAGSTSGTTGTAGTTGRSVTGR